MFLQENQFTIATEVHDYPEWHKGRDDYALWYIEIQQSELLDYLNQIRQSFSNYLLQPNERQFHITLFVCGFLNQPVYVWNDDFSRQQFFNQLDLVQQAKINTFQLTTGQIRSFESALFIEIEDAKNSLSEIRSLFSKTHQEIAPLNYCPHITLGLYSDEFSGGEILSKIEQTPQKKFDISVNDLTFGYYKAKILQGQLYPEHKVTLTLTLA